MPKATRITIVVRDPAPLGAANRYGEIVTAAMQLRDASVAIVTINVPDGTEEPF